MSGLNFCEGGLVVGTLENAIYELDTGGGDPKYLMEGHVNELWGLAVCSVPRIDNMLFIEHIHN